MIEQKINELFGDDEPTGFGTGWWSGVLSAFFGMLAFGAVVCLHFPQVLTSPELRAYYPMPLMRLLIQGLIVAAIIFGVVSAMLRRKKVLALTGMLFALGATLLGGASVPINETLHDGPAIGLDWFLLDMLLMTLIFSPIEVLWPAYPKQSVFRNEWLLDIVYFLSTHLPIQITSFLILLPATQLTTYLGIPSRAGSDGPPALAGAILPGRPGGGPLPSTSSIGSSTRCRSCGASTPSTILPRRSTGSRARALTWWTTSWCGRSCSFPMMFIFPHDIIVAYLFFVTIHATWTHCNFGPTVKWLEPYLILPRYHHWHHTSQKEAIDKNFAIHFPWIDRIFGTYYFPEDKWPDTYGLHNEKMPAGFWAQFFYPFTRKKAA